MLNSNKNLTATSYLKLGASAVALFAIVGVSGAAYAQNSADMETVVVTGYRASLEKALDIKRSSLDASDSILAEDIGKFPDMNVSESLQRIPGVALNRESGEGREITVRGLGAQFTRVLINGVEAVATVGSQDVSTSNPGSGAGGTNRGRGFDFNVFASDLFSALTVHKSNSASLEEGSLGATVQLKTAHPFDHPGFQFTSSAQAGYQSMAGSVNPRFAALVSDTFLGGRLGVLASAAYGTTNTLEEGTSSVRWMSDLGTNTTPFTATSAANNNIVGSVNGATCGTNTYALTGDCATFNSAFRPRFPRYESISTHSKRLGLTGSIQWQPDDKTLFTVDALYADFAQIRNENYLEANSFSSGANAATAYTSNGTASYVQSLGTRAINILSYTLGGGTGLDSMLNSTKSVQSVTATNVGLRTEHRLDHLDTRFMQITVDGSHEFTETFKMHVLAGWSESHHRNPIQATLAFDLGCAGTGATSTAPGNCGTGTTADPFSFNYGTGNIPAIHLGALPSSASWFLSNVRERQEYAFNSYRSVAADFEWKATRSVSITGGFDTRNFGYGTLETRRSNGAQFSEATTIPDAVRAVAVSNYSSTISLKGIDTPSGSTTSWNVANFDKAASAIGLWNTATFPLSYAAGYGNTGGVRENDYAGWLEANWDTEIYGWSLRGDAGVRYVQTNMTSTGYYLQSTTLNGVTSSALQLRNGKNVYHDWLPAMNLVLSPVDEFLIRFSASQALTRPNLGGMMPSGSVSVSGSNATASIGNPQIPPTRSKNLDLSFEWYYGKGSMISVAGFWKHLDNFVQTATLTGTWDKNPWGWDASSFVAACGGAGVDWTTVPSNSFCRTSGGAATPNLVPWSFSWTQSVKGAPLYGTEINWQQQLYFLPHPFDYFGVLLNYTYVQAQQKYYDSNAKLLMQADLNNMSRNSANGTIYYDDEVFQARLTGSMRSHYLIDANIASNYNNYGIWVKGTFNLDASASYKLNDSLMFTFDAINLTNQASNIYADKTAQRSYQFHKTGQVFYLGAKYTY